MRLLSTKKLAIPNDSGEAEVSQPHGAILRKEHVRGFQVAMHAITCVQVSYCGSTLIEDAASLKRPVAETPAGRVCPVPLSEPRAESVLAAELGLDVKHSLVQPVWARQLVVSLGNDANGRFRWRRRVLAWLEKRDPSIVRRVQRQVPGGLHRRWQGESAALLCLHGGPVWLHPCAVVASYVRVVQARPGLSLTQHTPLHPLGLTGVSVVSHRLYGVLATIQAVPAAPDVAKCTVANALKALKLHLESRRRDWRDCGCSRARGERARAFTSGNVPGRKL
mmetsp:Transcript_25038/g.58252  ORF Transcript_25038/g.58252 Transcript_25038/m.58252 type:complete len:279 (-) Transcript_25038:243-1079(-)